MNIGDILTEGASQLAPTLGAAFLQPLLAFGNGTNVTDCVFAFRTLEYILWHVRPLSNQFPLRGLSIEGLPLRGLPLQELPLRGLQK